MILIGWSFYLIDTMPRSPRLKRLLLPRQQAQMSALRTFPLTGDSPLVLRTFPQRGNYPKGSLYSFAASNNCFA